MFLNSKNLAKKLRGKSPDEVKIIEATIQPLQWHSGVNISNREDMQDKYTYNKHENEWRIWNPNSIMNISILD
jgi:hypothetical protein